MKESAMMHDGALNAPEQDEHEDDQQSRHESDGEHAFTDGHPERGDDEDCGGGR